MKIKKGDTVIIITGKERTKRGKVLRAFPSTQKLFVEGVVHAKHKRARSQGKKGEVIHVPSLISVSAVKLVCPKCGNAVRVGYAMYDGKKHRICKKCASRIEMK
ncbi:MAG: 50S ribosomal protein L24 [Patescibacteria group bacterium]